MNLLLTSLRRLLSLSELSSKLVHSTASHCLKTGLFQQQTNSRYSPGEYFLSSLSYAEILIDTRKDATLREVLTTLRNTAPHIPEYKHPLARFSFRTVYADPGLKGRYAQKDLGMVYSRDILGEPGALNVTAPRLLEDTEGEHREPTEREREEQRTLDELKFIPGDYLLIAVLLPKNVTMPNEISIKGSGSGWKSASASAGRADAAWGGPGSSVAPRGSEGHWRGGNSKHPPPGSRRGGRNNGESVRDKELDRDSRAPPPRRREPSPLRGGRGRGGRNDRRSRSHSRSPRRRYD